MIIRTLALTIFIVIYIPLSAGPRIVLSGGATLSLPFHAGEYISDAIWGWQTGLHLEIPTSHKFYIETGADFFNYSYSSQKYYPDEKDWEYEFLEEPVNSIQVPLKIGYQLWLNEKNSFLFSFGPYGAYQFSNDDEYGYSDEAQDWKVGLQGSVSFRHRAISLSVGWQNPCVFNEGKFRGHKRGSQANDIVSFSIGIKFGKINADWGAIASALEASGQVLGAVSEAYLNTTGSGYSSSSYSSGSSSSGSSNAGGGSTSTSRTKTNTTSDRHGSISELTAMNTDKRTYSNYETLLIKMRSSGDYKLSDKQDIQNKMRKIRTKWTKRGYSFTQSPLETW